MLFSMNSSTNPLTKLDYFSFFFQKLLSIFILKIKLIIF